MSESDVLDLGLARSAWKCTVAVRLGACNARLKWLPALENLGELRHAAAFGAVDRAHILLDDSAPSAHGHADGNWVPPCGGSAVTMHPQVPPWRRWHLATLAGVPAAAHAGGLLAGVAAGRHMGGGAPGGARHPAHAPGHAQGADVGHGLLCSPELADRAGVEVCSGAPPAVSAPPAAL
jgi:hypothetical protein